MTTPTPDPPEPTNDEIFQGATITLPDGRWGRACWFPSIGGYAGKALIVPPQETGACCTEVFVWHDGAFPFSSDQADHSRWPGEQMPSPVRLTVHGGQDFIAFGELVDECESAMDDEDESGGDSS